MQGAWRHFAVAAWLSSLGFVPVASGCGKAGNGAVWKSASNATTSSLLGVWGSGPNDVWVAGVQTFLHWTGTSWAVNLDTSGVNGIWGSGPDDVWAAGFGTILHWNGAAWASVWNGTTNELTGIWGTGPSDIWAVGKSGIIVHWNGRRLDEHAERYRKRPRRRLG